MITRTELNKEKQRKIIDEEKREKRKKLIKFFFKLVMFILIFTTVFFLYITYIANTKIIVKEQRIISKKIPSNFNGLKVIQFSDIHFGTTVFEKELNNLVKIINSRNPDLVIFNEGYTTKTEKLDGEEVLILSENDILAVVEE